MSVNPSTQLPADPEHDPRASYAFEPEYVAALTDRIIATSGGGVTSYAPATGKPLAVIPQSSEADVKEAFARARRAQQAWQRTSIDDRAAILLRLHDIVLDRQDEIIDLICWESGKSRKHAFDEPVHIALTARYYARTAHDHLDTQRRRGVIPGLTRAEVNRIPKGVVGIISPWNYPFTMALCDGIPALLAGNAVVTKPDAQTMLSALLGAQLLEEAGFPRDLWNVVAGPGRELGTPMIERSDYICFTGSTATGKLIAAQCADRLIGCSLELGGKNPILILRDADLDRAAEGAVRACFSNAGQLCVSTERMFVADQVYDKFVSKFVAATKAMRLSAGLEWGSDMGSLISQDQLDTVTAHVEDAVAKGATVLAGGKPRPDLGPYFFEPTILEGVTPEMTCFGHETFGPVISLYRFHDEADAVARANDGEYGLNGSIYSRDVRRARVIARQVKCGTININEAFGATFASIDTPMGGMRASGMGRRQGSEGIHRYTEAQAVASQAVLRLSPQYGLNDEQYAKAMTLSLRVMKKLGPGMSDFDFDVIVIGSGFGGSVSALRLTEKGYKVAVLEAGARFEDDDFADTSWDVKRYLFRPEIGCYGIQRIDSLKDCMIVSGAGVGGGSLVYANTLYEPLDPFYRDPSWAHITDWKSELAPYYDQAKRMLGVVENPLRTPSDEVMQQVAEDMGVGDTFHPTPVGVFFGGPGETHHDTVKDPYFGGAGPDRVPCRACGECMTGCRHNAKNTLVKNYLYLAEAKGARVMPLTTVTRIEPLADGGYEITTKFTKARRATDRSTRKLTAEQVVVAAASLGTQRLLHRMKDEGHLPGLSDRLGFLSRTNSEAILGAIAPVGTKTDYSRGVAITSSFHPDEHTHIEPVRYGRGSNFMSMMQTVLTDGDGPEPRWRTWLREMWSERSNIKDLYDFKHWSERTVIALVMQTIDNSITTYTKQIPGTNIRYMTSRQGHGVPNPTWIPVANQAVRRMADIVDGTAGGTIGEPFNRPLTAHFIGGCTIGDSPDTGVIDAYQRVYGHPGLHIADGSAISANLGVNPSLTITAQAERAMAYWPNKGEVDPRPDLGSAYESLAPVEPRDPAVPAGAPGALHLPIVAVS